MSIEGTYSLKKSADVIRAILHSRDESLAFDVPVDGGSVRFDVLHRPDWRVFRGIYIEKTYETQYDGVVVVDIGAHRGIYSAYALQHGCAALVAYEPKPTNFALLSENIDRSTGSNQQTEAQQKIVTGGESAECYVYDESWSHSTRRRSDKALTETIRVGAISLDDVVERAVVFGGDQSRVIVKIDVEGAEYEIVEGASTESLSLIDEMFIETHDYAVGDTRNMDTIQQNGGLDPVVDYSHNAGQHRLHRYIRVDAGRMDVAGA
jgi:FkbM family methyltransferase